MSDWKDRVADALASGAPSRDPAEVASPGAISHAFDELAAGLSEALADIAARAGLNLSPDEDPSGERWRWQYLTRSLMLRIDKDDGRVVLSVTTDRDYEHAEIIAEGGRLVACQDDKQGEVDFPSLIETFVTRFLLDSPQETNKP